MMVCCSVPALEVLSRLHKLVQHAEPAGTSTQAQPQEQGRCITIACTTQLSHHTSTDFSCLLLRRFAAPPPQKHTHRQAQGDQSPNLASSWQYFLQWCPHLQHIRCQLSCSMLPVCLQVGHVRGHVSRQQQPPNSLWQQGHVLQLRHSAAVSMHHGLRGRAPGNSSAERCQVERDGWLTGQGHMLVSVGCSMLPGCMQCLQTPPCWRILLQPVACCIFLILAQFICTYLMKHTHAEPLTQARARTWLPPSHSPRSPS